MQTVFLLPHLILPILFSDLMTIHDYCSLVVGVLVKSWKQATWSGRPVSRIVVNFLLLPKNIP